MKEWFVKMALEIVESFLGPERVQQLLKQLRRAIVVYLEELAKRTENQIDDKIVEIIKKAFDLEDAKS
jgi:hypothetical protein